MFLINPCNLFFFFLELCSVDKKEGTFSLSSHLFKQIYIGFLYVIWLSSSRHKCGTENFHQFCFSGSGPLGGWPPADSRPRGCRGVNAGGY